MAKYHIRKDGTPGVCHAQEGNCPLGGSENHVEAETLEQAQRQFDNKNEKLAKQITSDDYNYRSPFSDHGSVQVLRGSEPTAPSYEQRLEKAKSLDEYDVEEYLNNIYEEAFDIEPENAYTFSEEGDWSYEKDGIEVEYFVDTYDGEDYNTLNISDNGKLVRSFRLYPDDYDGESFDRIETVK